MYKQVIKLNSVNDTKIIAKYFLLNTIVVLAKAAKVWLMIEKPKHARVKDLF